MYDLIPTKTFGLAVGQCEWLKPALDRDLLRSRDGVVVRVTHMA